MMNIANSKVHFKIHSNKHQFSLLLAIKSNLGISTDNRSSIRVIYLSVVVVLTL